ncbi:MAG: ubiquinol-cytochrome C chaperone family protein [Sphingopyxis sp.]
MSFFQRLFTRRADPRDGARPLYDAVVAAGRTPAWYLAGAPDTLDGRFEIVTAVLVHTLLRMESDDATKQHSVYLTELFVDDMDGQLRQIGIGDMIVGKHIGKMMSALGGRLGAYRGVAADVAALRPVLVRTLWNGADPGVAADDVAAIAARFITDLGNVPVADVCAGQLPAIMAAPVPAGAPAPGA